MNTRLYHTQCRICKHYRALNHTPVEMCFAPSRTTGKIIRRNLVGVTPKRCREFQAVLLIGQDQV